ncbi:substrate-binding domain-containing protein [Kribbella sandramycini]|uniref:Ribose transport system substrate-binding protein n=1 Tax=Kribbella sandramycini TaxID=60450 RepID=A0A7Y4KWI6_9ACTN|nr:substrate-binding domain-containing protein [Kribbella sandramycini]MBB6567382.1 ribose transport system substrate-binding protein [Kribbella sandramycini]NOL40005.1 substrate-binding domain-containing protein [Kribbella sandramycini]
MRSVKIPLACAAVAAVVLAGCGTTSERTGGSPSDGAAKSCKGADGKYTIGMSQANVAEPYRQRMDDDIRAAAKEVPQFDVKFADAAQDNAKQVADVENYITQQIDLLIISPNEAKPLTAVVKKAFDKGIPVIVLDRKVEGDAYTGFIGGDNVQIGSEAGKYVAEQLLPDGGNIVELKGLAGATPQAERHQGFADAIKANPKLKIIAAADGDWLREKGQSQMDALLKANPAIDVVYAHNDPMAEGAYLAAKAAGREKSIKFIGIDALPIPSGGIKAVEQGRLSATFTYPTNGKEAVAAARKLLIDCAAVPKSQVLPTRLIDKSNAAQTYARENPAG